MKQLLSYFFFFFSLYIFSQEDIPKGQSDLILTPEIMVGITADPNKNFVDHGLQTGILFNLGWEHDNNPQEWAQRLKGPRTGISIGLADFGNSDSIGQAITIMPFIEFNAFRKEKLKIQVGMGGSYFNTIYDPVTNPNNQGVTTHINWSYRLFMHYQIISGEKMDWRMGLGYYHHSNGHTKLPNQGFNSFLLSLSADIKKKKDNKTEEQTLIKKEYKRSIYSYVSFRGGIGSNVLSKAYNDTKGVYTVSGEYGKVLNNTFKLGFGLFYRFYQNYYDYIIDNEFLVRDGEEFDYFKENPWFNATNLAFFVKAEVLLSHVGIDTQIGFNLYKQGYKIDWRINQGWSFVPKEIPDNAVLGEFDTKYTIKSIVSLRLGLKYYLISTLKRPKNNLYFAFHLNTNLGQADFTELSLGYLYSFKFKDRSQPHDR